LAGGRNSILVAGALLGHEFGLATASGVTSGLFRTRDVLCWLFGYPTCTDECPLSG